MAPTKQAVPLTVAKADILEENSVYTQVEILSGEVLDYVERKGVVSVRDLMHEMSSSWTLILMAAGLLLQQGLVTGTLREGRVLLRAH